MPDKHLTRHKGAITRAQREVLLGQGGAVIWLTGLSGAGKSTIAFALEHRLVENGNAAYTLDGDNLRHGLCADLGFTPADRNENIRRVGEAAALFADAGVLAIASFISPYRAGRERARERTGDVRFIEVYLDVSVDVCEARDPKGLYKKARAGEIAEFTGVSAPYEEPTDPTIRLDTDSLSIEQCVDRIFEHLVDEGFVRHRK